MSIFDYFVGRMFYDDCLRCTICNKHYKCCSLYLSHILSKCITFATTGANRWIFKAFENFGWGFSFRDKQMCCHTPYFVSYYYYSMTMKAWKCFNKKHPLSVMQTHLCIVYMTQACDGRGGQELSEKTHGFKLFLFLTFSKLLLELQSKDNINKWTFF